MLAKNEKRLFEHQLGYLRQISAYDISHAVLMLAGVLAAIIPLVRGFDRGDIDIVKWMAVVIISLYWLLQFRMLRSAVLMAGYKEQNASSPFAKARMVLWHHQTYIVIMSLMLLG